MHNEEIQYQKSFYNSGELKIWAKKFLEVLPKDVTTLASRGSSGCAIASAMIAISDKELEHVYVRKEHENSHGNMIVNTKLDKPVIAIVDDLLSSGNTAMSIIDKINLCTINFEIRYIIVGHIMRDITAYDYIIKNHNIKLICLYDY